MKKRILSGLLAAVMAFSVIGAVPAKAAVTEDNYKKFSLKLISGEGTTDEPNVEIAAYDNYEVVVDLNNDKVNRSAVTLDLTMTNIANLGVNETRHADFTFKTGLEKDGTDDLSKYIEFADFTKAVINGSVNGNTFKYNVSQAKFDTETVTGQWTATPESVEAVRAAWVELTSYVETKTYENDDSKVLIPNGAYLQVGTEKLYFETEDDLVLDNLNNTDALIESIKKAVKLDTDVEELKDCQMVAYIPAGATLRVGGSEAVLTEAATIKVDGMNEDITYRSSLEAFRTAANKETGKMTELVKAALDLVGDVLRGAEGQTLTVDITTADYEAEKALADAEAKAEAAEKAQAEAEAKAEAAEKAQGEAEAKAEAAEKALAEAKAEAAKAEATAKAEAEAKVAEAQKALTEAQKALAVTKASVANLKLAVSNSKLTATWSEVDGASKYNVVVKRNGKTWKTTTTTAGTYAVKIGTGIKYTVEVTPVATVDEVDYVGIAASKAKTVKLAKPVITAKKSGSKAKVALKKKITKATGYQVRIAAKSSMKNAKTYTIKSAAKFTKKYALKGSKTYIQVRAYRTFNGVKVYSSWSAKKVVKK